jgi:hypothetical protein
VPEYNTLLLDQSQWDLVLDANYNIAMGAPPYALAQDVASAVRTFLGECWYNTSLGVAYFSDAPAALLTQQITAQALLVPGVVTAQTIITSYNSKGILVGQILFTDENDQTTTINIGSVA